MLETDEATTLGWGRNLGNVDRDLGGLDTNGETVDNTTNNKHTDILRGADKDRTNHPVN